MAVVGCAKGEQERVSQDIAGLSDDVLDVPCLRRTDIPVVGLSACAPACACQILAYHHKIQESAMIPTARQIFDRTCTLAGGLVSRGKLVDELKSWGFRDVLLQATAWPVLWNIIRSELDASRPLILATRSMTQAHAGNFLVIRGHAGEGWENGELVCNDPSGLWQGQMGWYDTQQSGEAVVYDYQAVTAKKTDAVFVIQP